MKTCTTCGSLNKDENNFCCGCGATTFGSASSEPSAPASAPVQQIMPGAAPNTYRNYDNSTRYDLFTIFGFVASIIGAFVIALVLEPLALASAIIGFVKGKRLRGLAIAAIIIAIIALLIRLFVTLYNLGAIPEWLITGALD